MRIGTRKSFKLQEPNIVVFSFSVIAHRGTGCFVFQAKVLHIDMTQKTYAFLSEALVEGLLGAPNNGKLSHDSVFVGQRPILLDWSKLMGDLENLWTLLLNIDPLKT